MLTQSQRTGNVIKALDGSMCIRCSTSIGEPFVRSGARTVEVLHVAPGEDNKPAIEPRAKNPAAIDLHEVSQLGTARIMPVSAC